MFSLLDLIVIILQVLFFGGAGIAFTALLVTGLRGGRGGDTGTLWGVFFIGLIVGIALVYLFRY